MGVLAKEEAPKLAVCCERVTPRRADQSSTRDALMCCTPSYRMVNAAAAGFGADNVWMPEDTRGCFFV